MAPRRYKTTEEKNMSYHAEYAAGHQATRTVKKSRQRPVDREKRPLDHWKKRKTSAKIAKASRKRNRK